jgi:hypothetical protein
MKKRMDPTRFWRRLLMLMCTISAGALVLGTEPASAQSCIQEKFGKSLVCTANDVRIASAGNIRDIQGNPLSSCVSGQPFSFIADFRVVTGATARYDVGLWFATDGDPNHDGARTGVCSVNSINPKNATTGLGSANYVQIDGDACGDINTANNPQIVTVRIDNVACVDLDGDGKLNLPNCTSWGQNSGVTCTVPGDTVPGSPSKCSCDASFNIDIHVETGQIQVTKDASPASLPEPGGEITFTVGATNTGTFQSVTLDRICDDQFGTVVKVASAPACPAGTLGTINSTTCTLPQTLLPGNGTYSCTFKANVTSSTPTDVTNVVTVFGHDGNTPPNAVTGSDSAKVSITNVPPTASVVKSLVGLACADVNYRVKVSNTDTAESLTLTALTDSGFGDITSVHDSILATTCGVAVAQSGPGTLPATIPVGGSYECEFRAHFCGGSHQDTVTATLNDNDGGSALQQDSNALTVNVNAQ